MSTLPTPRFRFRIAEDRTSDGFIAGRIRARRRSVPMEVVVAGEHANRHIANGELLRELGFDLVPVSGRLETVLTEIGRRRPGALVVDLGDLTPASLELAQQIALRDEFLALPIVFLLPETARQVVTPASPPVPFATPFATPGTTTNNLGGNHSFPTSGTHPGHASLGTASTTTGFGWNGAANPFALPSDVHAALESILLGSADFLIAPFSAYELGLRLLRLTREPEPGSAERLVTAGPVEIDDRAHRVTAAGREVALRKKEYDLMLFLMRNAGVVFTREALLRWVWGPGFTGDARTVDVHVRRLRSKLGDDTGRIIETVRRVGYRLSVSGAPSADASLDAAEAADAEDSVETTGFRPGR